MTCPCQPILYESFCIFRKNREMHIEVSTLVLCRREEGLKVGWGRLNFTKYSSELSDMF